MDAIPLTITALLVVLTAEIAARFFWFGVRRIPLHHPEYTLQIFYPEMRKGLARKPNPTGPSFDILLLGGSIIENDWSAVSPGLREHLARRVEGKIRIFNLAKAGHNSLDSLRKYRGLPGARFDLVVFCPSINEARTNNVPPELFRRDYSHFHINEIVAAMARYHRATTFALPYTLHGLVLFLRHLSRRRHKTPFGVPRPEWTQHGGLPQNDESFRTNIAAIVDHAGSRGDRLVLLTLAAHDPPGYSVEAFRERRLDYSLHLFPFEIWGNREDVLAMVRRHNAILRELAQRNPEVLMVDQDALMPRSGAHFNDPCHLTLLGSSRFVENLIAGLPPDLRGLRGPTRPGC